MADIVITKSDGQRQPFDRAKLESSLRRSGADEALSMTIGDHIESELVDGMSAEDIYRHAFALLQKAHRPTAARYSLRRAIFDLGPTGFPFEEFIAEYFKTQGYSTSVDQIVHGKCVEHEVDVVAWNPTKLLMCEVKFHNEPGVKSDLKIALYIKARMDDLRAAGQLFTYGTPQGSAGRPLDEFWAFTNTKFSQKAIEYGECAGLPMVGWNYPRQGNLQDLIEKSGLHPITVLSTLSPLDKQTLFQKKIVLCRSLTQDPSLLDSLGIRGEKLAAVQEEIREVCVSA